MLHSVTGSLFGHIYFQFLPSLISVVTSYYRNCYCVTNYQARFCPWGIGMLLLRKVPKNKLQNIIIRMVDSKTFIYFTLKSYYPINFHFNHFPFLEVIFYSYYCTSMFIGLKKYSDTNRFPFNPASTSGRCHCNVK
jgi:hypothetical protein